MLNYFNPFFKKIFKKKYYNFYKNYIFVKIIFFIKNYAR